MSLQLFGVESAAAFSQAFKSIEVARPDALYVVQSVSLFTYLAQIMEFAHARKLPVVGMSTEFVEAGALMSYHAKQSELIRLAATQVAKILEGARPTDLPVQQASVFELVINRKTAKALGIKIPQSLLVSADRVIE